MPATRRVLLRAAMVMTPDAGGVFDTLLTLVRRGLGGPVAGGGQFVSWVHGQDFVAAVRFLIERGDLSGPVNLAAPHPLPYRDFMGSLRAAWGAKIGLPATAWMLEIAAFFLRTESELVLKSRRVVPGRLLGAGFKFQYPDWSSRRRRVVRAGAAGGALMSILWHGRPARVPAFRESNARAGRPCHRMPCSG